MASITRVVNIKHEPCTRYIGRGPASVWGNPWRVNMKTSREDAIAKYREYILNSPNLLARLHELKGHTLGCYCKPLACHGDVLVELLEKQERGELK